MYNLIPDWNDLVYRGSWKEALTRLHATYNLPEITGRVCPAPCEASCVLSINQPAVTIQHIELAIVEQGFSRGVDRAAAGRVLDGQARGGDRERARRGWPPPSSCARAGTR